MPVEATSYRPLTSAEIEQLEARGCTAQVWQNVEVAEKFDPSRLRDVTFSGNVRLGKLEGSVDCGNGVEKPAGVYGTYLADCIVGDGVRIANIGSHIANYSIGAGACIEDVGTLATGADATFGNGVEVEALNEGGGREVTLFNELSAQFAYLQCLVRWRPKLTERLDNLANAAANQAHGNRGTIGPAARVLSVARIVDVNIGASAVVRGAASLENGTILSTTEAPTLVGAGVLAKGFIVAEGSSVDEGAILSNTFVGQGCQIGKQFSAEASLFFANCEGFHGEACSLFAGPYTVSHHKSTLLIAGLMSFYNAGSGTNQSNHMYKLGPVHEGKLERGCKTGSFSYLMWPCRVGPFSVVLGKHSGTFDTRDFPFSHIGANAQGHCEMVPGLYLSTVGTVRDGAKWPARDRRKSIVKRDIIDFDIFSPLTVGRMLRGSEKLSQTYETADRSQDVVKLDGAEVRRVLLRKSIKFYQAGIELYLEDRLVQRYQTAGDQDPAAVHADAVFSEDWIDLAGQMMPQKRFEQLCDRLESGAIDSVDQLQTELATIHATYAQDEWAWVAWAYQKHFGKSPAEMTADDWQAAADSLRQKRSKFLNLVLGDASKEFNKITRTGFGVSGDDSEAEADFTAVRGTMDENKFVKQMRQQIDELVGADASSK